MHDLLMCRRALIALAVGCLCAPVWAQAPESKTKKVIEWGWDEPDPTFVRENIAKMEEHPFDGFVFHVNSNKGGNFSWELWSGRRFEIDEFGASIADLNATNFQRFTDRFLRVNVTPGKVDWFDDAAWATVQHNFGVAAQLAKQTGCKGFMFDVEQYDAQLFQYQQDSPHSFAEYQTKVRERGQQWMREVNSQFPDIVVLLTFAYELAEWPEGKKRNEAPYGMLADFIDGMLDACSEQTQLVNAWEFAYPYKQEQQFTEAHESIATALVKLCANPEKYRRHMQAGFGLWMDHKNKAWDLNDFSQNHFSPSEFEGALQAALKTSDQYVWIYTERPRWWTNEQLPTPYIEAVKQARASAIEGSR